MSDSSELWETILENFGMLSLAGSLFIAIIWIILWWIVFKKAGFSYPLLFGIFMAIPVLNIIMFLIFVFGEWPALKAG